MLCTLAVTLFLFTPPSLPRYEQQAKAAVLVCSDIVDRARDAQLDIVLPVGIGSVETGFRRDLESSAGAVGPLQVLPRYWCPKVGNCNSIDAALNALKYCLNKESGNETKALECYAGRGKRGRAYARRVMLRVRYLRAALRISPPTSH